MKFHNKKEICFKCKNKRIPASFCLESNFFECIYCNPMVGFYGIGYKKEYRKFFDNEEDFKSAVRQKIELHYKVLDEIIEKEGSLDRHLKEIKNIEKLKKADNMSTCQKN